MEETEDKEFRLFDFNVYAEEQSDSESENSDGSRTKVSKDSSHGLGIKKLLFNLKSKDFGSVVKNVESIKLFLFNILDLLFE